MSQGVNQPPSISSKKITTQQPWPIKSMVFVILLFGAGAAYLIIWQNFKRIGRLKHAKIFLIWGGIVTVILALLSAYLSDKLIGGILFYSSVSLPFWFYNIYLKQWQEEHPGQAQFSWSILGWGVAGLLCFILIMLPIIYLVPQSIPVYRSNSSQNTSKGQEFNEDQAVIFIKDKMSEENIFVDVRTIKFIIQKEWKWQYDNTPKDQNEGIILTDRSDARLLKYLRNESVKSNLSINDNQIQRIFFYLAEYEDSL